MNEFFSDKEYFLSTPQLICVGIAIAIVYAIKWAAKKYFPDMNEKNVNVISSIAFFIVLTIGFIITKD
ncbi:MAG: hypothetical protein ACI4KG_01045 [Oscillospiraceae bacterium]